MNRTIGTLARVRRLALDRAKRDLAAAHAAEAAALRMAEAAIDIIAAEAAFASAYVAAEGGDGGFAAWLPTARSRGEQARGAHGRSMAETERARACLADAGVALRLVEELAKRHAAARKAAVARDAQRALDEIGQLRARRGR